MLLKSLLSLATFVTAAVAYTELPSIEIIGNKFYFENNGSQFLMRGVAYQADTTNSSASYVDPLGDLETCKRDIPYLQELQTNIIRVYAINSSLDHTGCMELLQEAGIYLIADLSTPELSIDRADPEWTTTLYNRYIEVVDNFHNYTNVVGFFAGNEVTNSDSNTDASAYVKAAIRDVKAYISDKGYRTIPVGYSSNDDTTIRLDMAEYFACGELADRADFFGINMYEWCGNSTYKESGYETISDEYANLGIPIFFSEYGCNEVQPRRFTEVQAIYSEEMTDEWSGGIVYMYYEETNNYGLVTIEDDGDVSTLADFNYLKSELESIDPSYATANSASTSQSVTTCPTVGGVWAANTVLPPTPNVADCECMANALTCVVADDVSSDDYATLFSYVCGEVDCTGVSGNGTSGIYGAYSPCDTKQKLNFVLNLYYSNNGASASACDFDGSATTQAATTASSCSAVLSQAGYSGTGTISNQIDQASAASADGTSTSTGKSSSSSSSSKSSDASKSLASMWLALSSLMVVGCGLLFV